MPSVPFLGFVGWSDSGKTTLVTSLIHSLSATGLEIGAVKHHHKNFDIDHKGKDSWRFSAAGARKTVITSPQQTALIERTAKQRSLQELAAAYLGDLDLVLVEGFKLAAIPKIEVQRPGLNRPLITRHESYDPHLIAVVSDCRHKLDVPCFAPDEIRELTAFICRKFQLHPDGRK
jgi:molybdopterin-guanine dinucleotide biosynthesis protein MobB